MNNYSFIVQQEAYQDIFEAYQWYANQKYGLGDKFIKSLENCYQTIQANPFLYEKKFKDYRQAVVRKYPFVILYECNEERMKIIIYAVFHTSRNPRKKFRK